MKKVLYSVVLSLFVLLPINALAEGYVSVSPSLLTIEQGSSKTFTISAYNAIGDVAIRSNNAAVASVNINEWSTGVIEEKQTKYGTVTVNGVSVGTTTIVLTIDAATFDYDDLSGQIKIITINVVEKPAPQPTPTPTPQPNPVPSQTPPLSLSNNNNLKKISVEGYKLVSVDNKNYTLTVSNDVTSINVMATAEDSKAKVNGIGVRNLQVGENSIEVVVTSESGVQNKIIIKVTRKDGYYLEDLNSVLKNEKLQDANIIINADSKITKEQLDEIKNSDKVLKLNYYNENKKLIYSWTINGKEIKDSKDFATTITFAAENLKEIYKLSNYADGLYVSFKHNGDLPTGTKIKLYVGDKFEDESIVNVYHYNSKDRKMVFVKESLKVIGGYIEFEIEHCSEYFVTMSIIGNVVKKESSFNILMIFIIIELIVIIGLVIFIILKIKSLKKYNNVDIPKPNLNDFNNNDNIGNNINNNYN